MAQPRKLFVNLCVRDVARSKAFFAKLGFEFDARFSNENALSMIVSPEASVMLLAEPFFRTFTKKQVCDTGTHLEGLFALSCSSRAEVDQLVSTALANGGKPASPPQDHGHMYGWSFEDPDGHTWEVFWMDPSAPAPH